MHIDANVMRYYCQAVVSGKLKDAADLTLSALSQIGRVQRRCTGFGQQRTRKVTFPYEPHVHPISSGSAVYRAHPRTSHLPSPAENFRRRAPTAQRHQSSAEALANAARKHAQLMAEKGIVSHQLPGEPNLPSRAKAAGAHFRWISENIDAGQFSERRY
jgi:hypothetical protein